MGQRARSSVVGVSVAISHHLRTFALAVLAAWACAATAADRSGGVTPEGILTDTIAIVSGADQSGPTGSAGQPIVVEAKTPQGQPIVGRNILWTTNGHTLGATSSLTDATGRASVGFDFGPNPGAFTITATDSSSGFAATATATGTVSSITVVSGDHQSGAAGSHSTQPFVVEVLDGAGAPIVGRSITWTDNSGGAVILDGSSSLTDASGRASMGFTYTPTQPFANAIEARDPIRALSVFFSITTAGADTLTLVSGQSQNGTIGDHSTEDIVVEVRDGAGNPIAGRTISWTDLGANRFTLDAPTSLTDASGQARMGFTYLPTSVFCACGIQATDTTSNQTATAIATGLGAETLAVVSGQSQNGIVGSHSSQDIVVEARDALGNPVAGRTITWTDANGGRFTLDAASSVTDAAGQARVGFTYLPGSVGCGCTIQAMDTTSGLTANAVASGVGSETLAMVSGQSQNGIVGSHSTQDIVVEVRDALGNPIVGRTIDWTDLNGGRFTLDAASSVTDASGQARMGFVFLAGSVSCGCAIQAQDTTSGATQVAYATGIGGESLVLVSGHSQNGVIGSHSAQDIVIEVRDALGNVIAGRTINWSDNAGGRFTLDAATSVTDAAGQARMGFTFLAASLFCSCSITAQDAVSTLSVAAVASGIGADSFTMVSGNGQSGAVGSHSAEDLVVEVRDALGNPVVGRTINWIDGTGVSATLDAASSVTDAAGQARMGFTYLPGSVSGGTLFAADTVTTINLVIAIQGVGTETLLAVAGSNQYGAIGSHSTQDVVVEIRDAQGNPIVGRTVNWFDAGGPVVTLDASSSVTDGAGQARVGFTYLPASLNNSANIQVTDPVNGNVIFISQIIGVGGDQLTYVTPSDLSGPAGSPSGTTITVEVRDAQGAAVVGRTINWSVTSGDALVGAPSSATDAAGQASIGFTYGTVDSTIQAQDAVSSQVLVTRALTTAFGTIRLVSGSGQLGPVGTSAASPLVVELLDSAGAPIVGRNVSWSPSNGSIGVAAATTATDSSGQASVGLDFLVAGQASVLASDTVTGRSVIAYATATGAESMSMVSGNGQVGPIGTASAAPLVVEVLDAAGNPVVGRTINWNADQNVVVDAASSVTDASGLASMGYTYGTSPGPMQVSATGPGVIYFKLGAVGHESLTLVSGNGQTGTLNSAGAAPLVVEWRDSSGNLVVGGTVNWAISSGSATPTAPTSLTDGSGRASMTFTHGVSPGVHVTYAWNSGGNVYFNLTASGGDSLSLVSGNAQSGTIGTAGAAPLVVELRDPSGNPVVGATVNWASTCGGPPGCSQPLAATSLTDASGQASMGFTYGTSTSVQAIAASSASQSVLFTVTSTGLENLMQVSGNGQTGTVGTAGAAPLVVELRDASDNPVVGATINWASTCGGPPLCSQPLAATSLTDASGQASMGFVYGTATTVQSIAASSTTQSLLFTVTAVGGQNLIQVSGNGQSGTVGTASAAPMVVELRDASDVPVSGATINWASTCGGPPGCSQPVAASSLTDASGQASMAFTYGTTTSVQGIQASSGGLTAQFTMTATGLETLTLVSGNGQSGTLNTAGAAPLVVELLDASGNPIAGRSISWTGQGAGFATPVGASSLTDASGHASMAFNYGNLVIASVITAMDTITGKSVNFDVTASGSETLTLVSGNGQSGDTGTAGAAPIVVEALDAAGNPIVGRTINWIGALPAVVAAPSTVTDATGRASVGFSYSGIGQGTITATDAVNGHALSASVTSLQPGEQLTVTAGAGQSGSTGAPGAPLTVRLLDSLGNPIAGRGITWSQVGASDLAFTSATSTTTDANGDASITFTFGTAGTNLVRATEATWSRTAELTVAALPGTPTLTVASGDAQSASPGTAFASPLVVNALNGAVPSPGLGINWAVTSGSATLSVPANATDLNGDASNLLTAGATSGPVVVTATRADDGSVVATFNAVVTAVVQSLTVTGGDGQTAPTNAAFAAPLVVHADDDGVPVAGVTINWATTAGSAIVAPTSVTDASGNATNMMTAGGSPGPVTVTATRADAPSAIATFTATVVAQSLSIVSGDAQTAPANAAFAAPLVVHADDGGVPVAGVTIDWVVTAGSATLAAPTSVTDASGNATIALTAGPTAGPVTVTATRQDAPTANTFFSETVVAQGLAISSGDAQSATANTAFAAPLVVHADDGGAPAAGVTIDWVVTAGSATVSAPSSVTDASGNATITLTAGAVAGPVAVSATRQDAPAATVSFSETVTAVVKSLTLSSGDAQSATANTAFAAPLVVHADDGGAPAAGVTIDWVVTAGSATLAAPTSVTDASGNATIALTAGPIAGPVTVSATRQDAPAATVSFSETVTAVVKSLAISGGDAQSATANTAFAAPLVVHADDGGAPAAGVTIDWVVTAGSAAVAAPTSVTDASGNASIALTAGATPGPVTVTGTRQDAPAATVAFTATVTAIKALSVASGDGQSATVNTAFAQPLDVFADDSGAPAAGVTINWLVTAGSATVSAPASVTDATGHATIGLAAGAVAGPVTVTATRQDAPAAVATFNATATPVAPSPTLTLVSGDNQALATNTASAPLVVELRDVFGNTVAGATVTWAGTNATPSAANSVTDAAGRTSVTATVDQAGAATVVANSAGVAAPVTFNLNGSVAILPGLTEEEAEVAEAIDALCPALANVANPTPEQLDLLARCNEIIDAAGLDPQETVEALEEMLSETGRAQSTAAVTGAVTQIQNVKARLAALRSGSPTSSLGGLTLVGPGGQVSLGSLTTALLGEGDQDIGADFDRWGWFATGSIGRGEADATGNSPAYDFDINGITAGIDYRYRDDFIAGAALGYSRQDTDLADDEGRVEMRGWSLSAYGTYSFKDTWYLDGVVTWGRNRFDMQRRIAYTLPLPGGGTVDIDQTATGRPSGNLFETSFTFGGDFHKNAWSFGPYARLTHTHLGFDGYTETMESGPGSGLALVVDSRDVTAFTGVLGGKLAYTHSADWGVFVPTASLEWEREFKDDLQELTARFLHDPTGTPMVVTNDPLDNQYFRVGLGMSLVLKHGRSGFVLYERMVGRDGMEQENLSLGVRVEF
jgi:uncharacterized protein YhjY with autotransporter beta-barrel domain/5-hydroxyisourate hydrolase-like protein (transthyretin family)